MHDATTHRPYRQVLDPDLTVPSSFIEPRRSLTITAVAPVVSLSSQRQTQLAALAERDWFLLRSTSA